MLSAVLYQPLNTKSSSAFKDLPYFHYKISCNLLLTCETQDIHQLSNSSLRNLSFDLLTPPMSSGPAAATSPQYSHKVLQKNLTISHPTDQSQIH